MVAQFGSFDYVRETQVPLDWADLITIDLSLYSTSEGRQQLAKTLISAVREKGFFYVKNFNISQERVDRQFHLGKRFYELPLEEKLKYVPEGLDQGKFNGYVPAGRRTSGKTVNFTYVYVGLHRPGSPGTEVPLYVALR
ncbi:hypothetical protein BDZ89DRAFT_518731 [Hymenopellis radicata]|nr:hypothetical protein BDZ89DRAFT_518731 [Hymenopellis radicata]